jgi:DNA-binding transcriptional regulator GbsR (MarR family)
MGKEYLTVAEYAEIKGISKQAVYKQLNNKLNNYVETVEGKKCLKISILEEGIQPNSTKVEQPIQPFLEAQIKEKDKTIDSLLRQIEALQEQNTRLTELLHNSQVLLAVEKQALIQEQASTHTEEPQDKPTEQKKRGFIYRLFGRNK